MNRRSLLTSWMAAAAGAALPFRLARAQEKTERAVRALPSPKIKDVQVIATAPAGLRLTVVKVVTDQDGLYGYGCGTFTQRAELVNAAVEKYLRPFLIGKAADRIDDLWQAMYNSSYWRNGPVLNNAISGVDQALWDIKGRQAGMPVYQLAGGKHREAVDCYSHASGQDIPQVHGQRQKNHGARFPSRSRASGSRRHGRIRFGARRFRRSRRCTRARYSNRRIYMRAAVKMLEACRKELGDEVELLHDVHERVSPIQAVQLAKAVEPFRLYFLEDVLSPEDIAYFRLNSPAMRHAAGDGRAFQQPARVDSAHLRAADRLYAHACERHGWIHAGTQSRAPWERSSV